MTTDERTPLSPAPPARRTPVALVAAAAVLLAVFGAYPLLDRAGSPVVEVVEDLTGTGPSGPTGVAGGAVPDGGATLDDDLPAITGLDPDLAATVRRAADDAAAAGVDLWVTSGWRSPAFQQRLLDDAVRRTGSLEEARRTVSTPELSRHVTGEAVDIGPTEGAYWMLEHGTDHGLCQVYANEVWHFELRTAPGGSCPDLLEDSSPGAATVGRGR
ncbi:M15 family metallopeptidase [Promicromonospora thailandica]|uniref:D-alanyl-D-alanine carboxypeptidase n=1 Tax=Promicromonospora thailandica TaxID=765201 RepID=A0A9X2K003_9MICO|nr:M15 family metallopeptidase [Promicromonospora thailandica]MCP2266584.1 D-alanyl-D-alanine carboxypeptidase [Promicromonospora thailandica]BFF17341.1 M15 family metallopeptidase [Promicromonospora thailandica]